MASRILFNILAVALGASMVQGADNRGPLNQELPSWLTLGVQTRLRAEGQHGIRFTEGNDQDFLLQRYRFSTLILPNSWLQFYGEIQDSRSVGIPTHDPSYRDTFDLRQAYVGLGKEGGLWDLRVGRQRLAFGSERLLGNAEWSNVPRVYDGARLALQHGSDRVDLFAASVVQSDADHWDHHKQGNNLYGAYASIGSLIAGGKIEPYFLYRVGPSFGGEFGKAGHYDSSTMGVRTAGGFRKLWTYESEMISQRGTIGTASLRAWAFMAQGNRRISQLPWNATLSTEFNYASGDRRQGDGQVNTFDQLYPTNHLIYGLTDQQGRRNAENVRAALKLQPRKWLTVRAEERYLWLASKYDALYVFNGAISVPAIAGGARYRDVGSEFDVMGDFVTSKYYSIGAQWGHLTAGKFLKTYSPGSGRGFYAFFFDFHL